MQQGRVTLGADWNEDDTISGEELRHETLDIVGPAGTLDDGYRVLKTTPLQYAIRLHRHGRPDVRRWNSPHAGRAGPI